MLTGIPKYLRNLKGLISTPAQIDSTVLLNELGSYYSNVSKYVSNKGYRLNTDGSLLSDSNWTVSDYIDVKVGDIVEGYTYQTSRVAIATYDTNKTLIATYFSDTLIESTYYKKTLTINDSNVKYVRMGGSQALYHVYVPRKKTILENSKITNTLVKKDYISTSAIFFTVSVNQNFQDVTNTADTVQDSESFLSVYCAMYLPTSYQAFGKKSKIAVCMHGAGGMVTATSSGELSAFSSLLDEGYVIFDVNGSNNNYTTHSDHMSSPRALEAYNKAFEYIKENYNVEDTLYVHGHSMGGLTALNFANRFPNKVKVLGLVCPVTDLYNQAWLNPWFGTTKQQLAIEHNFVDKTGATWESAKVVGFNPIENNIQSIPIKIWHGDADTTVNISGSQALITRLKNNGVMAYLRTVTGMGHTHVNINVNKEQTMWFNRF